MTVIQDKLGFILGMQLQSGPHDSIDEGMCVMEAVSYIAGEPWSDRPVCACPVISAFMRQWNDDLNTDDRNRLLAPFVQRPVGTKSTRAVEERRAWMVVDGYVREHASAWLELTQGFVEHAKALRACDAITDTASAARAQVVLNKARFAAYAASSDAAACAAACAAAWDATRNIARAAAARAWAAARDAAKKLKPTVDEIQASAVRLLERMTAETDAKS